VAAGDRVHDDGRCQRYYVADDSRAASRYRTSLQAAHAMADDRHPLAAALKAGFREFRHFVEKPLRPSRISV